MDIECFKRELETLKNNNNFRSLRKMEKTGKYIYENGIKMLNLCSNDYLGLAGNPGLQDEFMDKLENVPMGSSSSRLLTGNHKAYDSFENFLSKIYQRKGALMFNSGYHANTGILPAIAGEKDLIIADKMVHASIIDGLMLSKAKIIRYRHNDMIHLEKILQKYSIEARNIFIVTETIFSMDGDLAPLLPIIELKKKYKAFLYLDEAHAVGVRGPNGLGIAEEYGVIQNIDFIVGTFGKAYASLGAFLICNALFRDLLINKMRSLIFTTALPPLVVKWSEFVYKKALCMESERKRLHNLSVEFYNKLKSIGIFSRSKSHIIPYILGGNEESIKAFNHLKSKGYYALPVKYPTVPKETSRLRFSLTIDMKSEDIENIVNALNKKANEIALVK